MLAHQRCDLADAEHRFRLLKPCYWWDDRRPNSQSQQTSVVSRTTSLYGSSGRMRLSLGAHSQPSSSILGDGFLESLLRGLISKCCCKLFTRVVGAAPDVGPFAAARDVFSTASSKFAKNRRTIRSTALLLLFLRRLGGSDGGPMFQSWRRSKSSSSAQIFGASLCVSVSGMVCPLLQQKGRPKISKLPFFCVSKSDFIVQNFFGARRINFLFDPMSDCRSTTLSRVLRAQGS